MNAIRTTLVVALAAVVLIGTGAAAGAVTADTNANDSPAADGDAGPPSDLPDPVPEFVGDLLDAIDGFLSGATDDLGDIASGIAGGNAEGAA